MSKVTNEKANGKRGEDDVGWRPRELEPVELPIRHAIDLHIAILAPNLSEERRAAAIALGKIIEMAIFSSQESQPTAMADAMWSRVLAGYASAVVAYAVDPDQIRARALDEVEKVIGGSVDRRWLPSLLASCEPPFANLTKAKVDAALVNAKVNGRGQGVRGPVKVLLLLAESCGAWPDLTYDHAQGAKMLRSSRTRALAALTMPRV